MIRTLSAPVDGCDIAYNLWYTIMKRSWTVQMFPAKKAFPVSSCLHSLSTIFSSSFTLWVCTPHGLHLSQRKGEVPMKFCGSWFFCFCWKGERNVGLPSQAVSPIPHQAPYPTKGNASKLAVTVPGKANTRSSASLPRRMLPAVFTPLETLT